MRARRRSRETAAPSEAINRAGRWRDMMTGNRRYELLQRIQRNGLLAMAAILARGGGDDSTYFDCIIGNRLTHDALERYVDAPPEVRDYITAQMTGEQCHCKIFSAERSEAAERIASFHLRVIAERNWPSFLACMPLLGERMALTTAFCLRNTPSQDRSSHTTEKGFLDEFWHTSAPLVLLSLFATEGELELACRDQEGFLSLMKVPPSIYDATNPQRCSLAGRGTHAIAPGRPG